MRTAAAHFVAVVLGDYTLWMSFCLRMYLARSMTSEGPSAPSVIVMGDPECKMKVFVAAFAATSVPAMRAGAVLEFS